MNTNICLVSILIPTFNRVELIEETINSALNQTYNNIEIIINDNYSTDGTWELLEHLSLKDKRIKIYQNEKNVGPVLNWIKCLNKAEGRFSKILYSDDLIDSDYIYKAVKAFEDNDAFILSKFEIFNETKVVKKSDYKGLSTIISEDYIYEMVINTSLGFPVSPSAGFFRTSDLKFAIKDNIENSFNIDFIKYGAGVDLWIFLLIANKYKQGCIKIIESHSYFRSHEKSFSVAHKLKEYYELARYMFVKKYKKNIIKDYKSRILIRGRKNLSFHYIIRILFSDTSLPSLKKIIDYIKFKHV